MQIVILCIVSFLLTLFVGMYLLYDSIEDETKSIKNILQVVKAKKSIVIYAALMFASLCGISISLSMIYESNTLVKDIKAITLLAVLFTVAWVDFKKYIIPNKVILTALVLRCVFYIAELITVPQDFFVILKGDLAASLIVVVFFVAGVLVVKNGLGMGDIKLMFVMCLYQGFYGVIGSLFLSLIVAFVFSIIFLILRKKTRKDAIPFAPSILIGTIISVFLTGM